MEVKGRKLVAPKTFWNSQPSAAAMLLSVTVGLTDSVAQAEPPTSPLHPPVVERPESSDATGDVKSRFVTLVAEARRLYREASYAEALQIFQAAQKLEQPPWIHLELARTYRRLGQTESAFVAYRQFLTLDSNVSTELRNEAELAIRQLTGRPALALPVPQLTSNESALAAGADRFVPHAGMRNSGWVLLSTGYAISAVVGILASRQWAADVQTTDRPASITGYSMLVPVAGPLVSATMAVFVSGRPIPTVGADLDPTTYYALSWSLPVLLLGAGTQITGLALLFASYSPKYRRPRSLFAAQWFPQIAPYTTNNGAGLSLHGLLP